uniref:Post-SET domain-containing protein n=1 Tax=Acrobeloides nanus TaxID=290746 RepID=A0A914D379_9BILA
MLDGLIEKELDDDFTRFFKIDQIGYSVLSLCLFEKYDWPSIWKYAPKHMDKIPSVEYQFRCLCNTDFCNGAMKFDEYLDNLKKIHS